MDSHPEDNRKLPAAAMSHDDAPQKRRKDNEGNAVAASDEVFDAVAVLGFQMGERIEVKWNIGDDDDEQPAPEEAAGASTSSSSKIAVWWPATLSARLNEFHTLTDDERNESGNDDNSSPTVKVPIYQLYYSPLEELGFDEPSLEDVAFLSNTTLLTLSSEEIMHFRKEGDPSPPSSPAPSDDEDEESIIEHFNSPEEIRSYMNEIMQRTLKRTGMEAKMSRLAASQQIIMAERINNAQEAMLDKLMAEMNTMEKGKKLITADVVKRCVAQMEGI